MTPSDCAILTVESAEKAFGALKAVNGISFTVCEGEIFGIAGPNGSGKSTLFNIITGIPFNADGGRFSMDGIEIARLRPHERFRRGLARTFQTETSFDALTVRENLSLAAIYGGAGDAATTIDRCAATVGLDAAALARVAGDVSVFEKKKLMIATAIVNRPRLLLLDEPAAGLTRAEVDELKTLIWTIQDDGISILLVEHVLPLLLSVSARVLVMNHGEEVMTGTPEEIVKDTRVIEAYLGGTPVET